jgi:hypothetical protein
VGSSGPVGADRRTTTEPKDVEALERVIALGPDVSDG